MRLAITAGVAGCAAIGTVAPAHAQRIEVWLDAAGAHARPPAGVPGVESAIEPGVLGWIGGRARVDEVGPLSFDATLYGGRGDGTVPSAWWTGSLGAEAAHWLSDFLVGARTDAFGLTYRAPFDYGAYAFSFAPFAVRSIGPFRVTARAEWTRGGWRSGAPEFTDRPSVAGDGTRRSGPLAVTGLTLAAGKAAGPAWLEIHARTLRSEVFGDPETFKSTGASATLDAGRLDFTLGATRWTTPVGVELGWHGDFALAISERLTARIAAERTALDPLYGTPGNFTATFGVQWKVASHELHRSMPVVEVAELVGSGRRVRFRLPASRAESAAVAGDFTAWTPRDMERSGEYWLLEVVLEPGVHYFGFLLNGDHWFVPENAPGIVDDGWGRPNATILVAEPA